MRFESGLTRAATVASGKPSIRRRRLIVFALNAALLAALLAAMTRLLSYNGMLAIEWAMLAAFGLTLPWLCIGVWNAVIGLVIDAVHGPAAPAFVTPALARVTGKEPISARVAIVMPLRNEDADTALGRLQTMRSQLAATPWAHRFRIHILSDSDRPEVIAREEHLVSRMRAADPSCELHYRRRAVNSGFKSGNIAEFCARHATEYDFFLPLDADSVMAPDAILRLVRVMQKSPEIGMLQSLVTGLPAQNFFTRAFQFGMRHGMRSFTLGAAWWQADCGPNWGHNVLIRMQPFHQHCMLPVLPGKGPLSGHILSHDQFEAALMRRAGFEVRVLAEEIESYEDNPPSVADFVQRELRWCLGNMQYLRLLGMEGLKPASRVQLLLAIMMYLSPVAWMLFVLLGVVLTTQPGQFDGVPLGLGLGLFGVLVTFSMMPKLMGLIQTGMREARAECYGGRARLAVGGLSEIVFGILIAPIVAFSIARFAAGLLFGKRMGWDAQRRQRERLGWREAASAFWPQTIAGVLIAYVVADASPAMLAFGAPLLLALSLSVPIAVLSTAPALGRWSRSAGLFAIPEEHPASGVGMQPPPLLDPA